MTSLLALTDSHLRSKPQYAPSAQYDLGALVLSGTHPFRSPLSFPASRVEHRVLLAVHRATGSDHSSESRCGARAGCTYLATFPRCTVKNISNSASKLRPASDNITDFGSDDWCTPKWLADALGDFDLDPCANDRSHIRSVEACSSTGEDDYDARDGLTYPWRRVSVFVNCPYSNVMPWAVKLTAHGGPWCALVKLDPTTRWWATLMVETPTVAPFRKRLKFEGANATTANFPSVLVYSAWRPPVALRPHLWLPTYAIGGAA